MENLKLGDIVEVKDKNVTGKVFNFFKHINTTHLSFVANEG